ncbi:hypothetical protein MPH47_06170 [Psychrobacillus psychrodurans]|uniref:hypothetical protein n=1 Tax=Psychrobacillus psychrodurans TaxID=126157 RepID=UPI001F4EDC63|nr:hypothetical protein [Psychrobacillus psychrodurans]MCK1996816.1 hypothetical protein [Psychrobacillus psychrodurans]
MTIEEEIIANDILRELSQLLTTSYQKEVLALQTGKGLAKYPNTVNTEDYSIIGWIDHNVQGLMDSSVYYKVLIKKIELETLSKRNETILYMLREDLQGNLVRMQRLENIRNSYLEEIEHGQD